MAKVTLTEGIQVEEVQGKLVYCPNCRATRFHQGLYVEIRHTTGGLKLVPVFSEFRCLGCNNVYSEAQLSAQG